MITIKNKQAIQKMYSAGQMLADIMQSVCSVIKPGVSTLEIDAWIDALLKKKGMVSQSKGYKGYRHSSCISINDEVVHGVPCSKKIINQGDLVKVDICAAYQGYCADMARCFIVDDHDEKKMRLVEAAQRSLDRGIERAIAGNRLGDISSSIQQEIEHCGYGIVQDFAGHGIGKYMHEEPEVLNYGKPGRGPLLRAGMAFALEPMITMGNHAVYVTDDGWTVKTKDKSLAAHVEDTVIITEKGPLIVTRDGSSLGIS